MLRQLSATHRSWPLAAPFRIARGVKTVADTVEVSLRHGGHLGRGESVPYSRYGETVPLVLAQIASISADLEHGAGRRDLQNLLPPGAARNALDTALWDLESRQAGVSVDARLGQSPLENMVSALTLSLDTPEKMAAAAAAVATAPLIKLKVDAWSPAERIRAVRQAAPLARLIVDPNESWDMALLREMQPVLLENDVALVEQPLPADDDQALEGFTPARPICADESCHVAADLPRLRARYQAVNIKLDKTGGLTGALQLLEAAKVDGFLVMVGCMVGSSLGIAPALHVARHAAFVDLDGPWWLKEDMPGGVQFQQGHLLPPAAGFWGNDA